VNTLGWLFIFSAVILGRQVTKGRVMNLGEDLSDAFIAVASGDTKSLGEVLSRSGDSTTVDQTSTVGTFENKGHGNPANAADKTTPANNVTILREAVNLGEAAKGYKFGASGPDYYDCSGLVWRACQKVGFTGGRFTTFTIRGNKSFQQLADPSLGVSQVTLGDLVVWPRHHMGIVSGKGRFYSARNPRSGIGEASIDGFRGNEKPIYLRYIG
jgi:cell wall-associated NlpC family hydrolase